MKKLIWIFIIIAIIVIAMIYLFSKHRTYTLNLPKLEKVESILLSQNSNEIIINDNEVLEKILGILNGNERSTKEESIQDYPVNFSNIIKIDFNFKETGTSTIFVYEKNNKYYIEQPYNGIYRISIDEYSLIEEYLI